MIIPLKYFHDSLNIVVILAPGRGFFPAKCAKFYEMKLNKADFSFRTVIVHFLDKPYQEINFKSH